MGAYRKGVAAYGGNSCRLHLTNKDHLFVGRIECRAFSDPQLKSARTG